MVHLPDARERAATDSSASKQQLDSMLALAAMRQALPPVDVSPVQPAVSAYSLHRENHPLLRRKTGNRQHHLQERIDRRMDKLEVTWRWRSACFRFLECHGTSQRHRRPVCVTGSLIHNRPVRESVPAAVRCGRRFLIGPACRAGLRGHAATSHGRKDGHAPTWSGCATHGSSPQGESPFRQKGPIFKQSPATPHKKNDSPRLRRRQPRFSSTFSANRTRMLRLTVGHGPALPSRESTSVALSQKSTTAPRLQVPCPDAKHFAWRIL